MASLSARRLVFLLLCVGLTGCLSAASHLGAAPTPRGSVQWWLALDGLLFERGREAFLLPALELTGRRGMGPDWDMGFRVYGAGVELGTRHRLLTRGALTLGAQPSLELAYAPLTNNTVELLHARARGALVADLRLTRDWTLTLGTRLAFGGAAPPTFLRGYGDGAVLLAQPEGLASLALELGHRTQLRLEAGAGRPFQIRGGARPWVGSGGISLSWTRD